MKSLYRLLPLVLIFFTQLDAKIRFLTFHYNKPDFLELQIRAMNKFIQDDFELIVINDAPTSEMERSIRQVCEQYQITCLRYEQEWHLKERINQKIIGYLKDPQYIDFLEFRKNYRMTPGGNIKDFGNFPGMRHSHAIQFALDRFGYNHNDLVIILDGDMFPIRPVNIRALQENYDVMGLYRYWPKEKLGYMWVPFISLNMPKLPHKTDIHFYFDIINGYISDTGSSFHYYLQAHPQLSVKKFTNWPTSSTYKKASYYLRKLQGFNKLEAELCEKVPDFPPIEFHINNCFLHYLGSTYMDAEYKSKCVTDFLNTILN